MTDEERGLLAAIAERPEIDDDRHVYADWLTDHGDVARAEFVRLQLTLARLDETHPSRAALQTRECGLLLENESTWALGLYSLVDGWNFRRGFVHEVVIRNPPGAMTGERFDEIFAWPFVRRVSAPQHGWRLLTGLAASAGARSLAELRIADTELKPQDVRAVIDSPHLIGLTRLELPNCGLGPNTVRRLAQSEMLERLNHLILADNPIGSRGIAELARSPRIGNLRHLDLRRCRLDDDSTLAIASAPLLANLRTLLLTTTGLSDDAVISLLSCPHLRDLVELDLSEGGLFGPIRAWDHLAQREFPKLTRLAVNQCHFGGAQLLALLSSPRLPALRFLDLSSVWMLDSTGDLEETDGPSGVPLTLRLSSVMNADVTFLIGLLSRVPAMRRVHRLEVSGLLDLDDEATLEALINSPYLGNVRHLDLSHSAGVSSSTLSRLCGSEFGKKLTALSLNGCDLSDGDVVILARANMENLTWLSLNDNHIGSLGARTLAESPSLRNLCHLDLGHNHIGDDGAMALAQAEHLASPVVLNVSNNDIRPENTILVEAARRAFGREATIPFV